MSMTKKVIPSAVPTQINIPIEGKMYTIYYRGDGTFKFGEFIPEAFDLYGGSEYGYMVVKVSRDEILNYEEDYVKEIAELNQALKEGRERWQ